MTSVTIGAKVQTLREFICSSDELKTVLNRLLEAVSDQQIALDDLPVEVDRLSVVLTSPPRIFANLGTSEDYEVTYTSGSHSSSSIKDLIVYMTSAADEPIHHDYETTYTQPGDSTITVLGKDEK